VDVSALPPRDGVRLPVQRCFPQDRFVAAPVQIDHHPIGLHLHDTSGFDETPVQLLRSHPLEPLELLAQPAVAAVGRRRQACVTDLFWPGRPLMVIVTRLKDTRSGSSRAPKRLLLEPRTTAHGAAIAYSAALLSISRKLSRR